MRVAGAGVAAARLAAAAATLLLEEVLVPFLWAFQRVLARRHRTSKKRWQTLVYLPVYRCT